MALARGVISSRWTPVWKWGGVPPLIVFVGSLSAYGWPPGVDSVETRALMVCACALLLVLVFMSTWNAADEVVDAGDRLKVRLRGVEAIVLLADIEQVSIRNWSNPDRIVLKLRKPGWLGDRIMFIPRGNFWLSRFGGNGVYLDLRERIGRGRS
ncbi:hypothetical protein J5226_13310 [Lysobacter sp. K5869]|uniref:hypothetical protein n=1 Tax=Lysobacter sp. K5869 TaxID=2820808 RepID=UPI001C062645|nr:hypothetical protein [Lysobacter sp. K5869]QWP74670.1 hypothetical protein J5226_13310 [Lysobacter sp. K5869]